MAKKTPDRAPRRAVVFLLKILLFVVLFVLFFGIFSIENDQLLAKNRTAAITMTTFVVLGIAMTAVYGGFAVGKKKSKEIIPSLCIAVFITDFITYFQLALMNTNRWNQYQFRLPNLLLLALVFFLQSLVVAAFVYLGNHLYFQMYPPEDCVIICSDRERAGELVRRVSRYQKQYRITGVIDYRDKDLKKQIRHSDLVFLYELPANIKAEIIDYAYKHSTNIFFQTELSDIVVNYAKYTVLDDLSMLGSTTKELSVEQRFLKRMIDLLVSGLCLVLLSPVMLAEALAIKLGDGGPVFYRQERMTIGGKKFNVLKFRTMVVNAEKQGAQLATRNDSRITPVGRFLRATRMDELPQFLNVLKGDMSIVGPRPERESIAEEYYKEVPEFAYRLRAKAGLTGLAQIAGKYNTSPKDKLMLDLMYIERYSVWMDILLIFQTLTVFFKRDSTEGIEEGAKTADKG
ncbi:MAG: sugar transferase [Oscillospiraceae bacterium]|jgi:exopolysaccharide biosynthesis polyprenyl glycosylphosphotransferase|nr:sugar transferase [Oscillospiraceae bacterium]